MSVHDNDTLFEQPPPSALLGHSMRISITLDVFSHWVSSNGIYKEIFQHFIHIGM
jgi:hypothetical protein